MVSIGPKSRPSILVMTSTFPRWEGDSQPRFVLDLCKEIKDHYDVTVVAPHCRGARKSELLEGVEVVRFQYAPSKIQNLAYEGGMLTRLRECRWRYFLLPMFFLSMLSTTIRLLLQKKCALIHAHWIVPQAVVAVLVKKLFFFKHIKIILTSHGGDLHTMNGPFLKVIKRSAVKNSDAITVVSNDMKDRMLTLTGKCDALYVAPMGTDLKNKFRPEGSEQKQAGPLLLFVGRLVEKKGVRYLIQAMSDVKKVFPDSRLRIVGDGPDRSKLRALSEQLTLTDSVEFTGAVEHSQLSRHYRSADIAVFPFIEAQDGDQEGFGLVVVEAMGCGCPVVASNLGALKDTMFGDNAERLVPQRDTASLAKTIISTLLKDEGELESIARRNRKFVLDNFDWKAVGGKYKSIIKSVING